VYVQFQIFANQILCTVPYFSQKTYQSFTENQQQTKFFQTHADEVQNKFIFLILSRLYVHSIEGKERLETKHGLCMYSFSVNVSCVFSGTPEMYKNYCNSIIIFPMRLYREVDSPASRGCYPSSIF
jgi:hypothetical protein